jgi:hypothetical protein
MMAAEGDYALPIDLQTTMDLDKRARAIFTALEVIALGSIVVCDLPVLFRRA